MNTTTDTTTMNTTTTRKETSHAEQNAISHAERIEAMGEAVGFCRNLDTVNACEARDLGREARGLLHEHGWDGTNGDDTADAIEEAAREEALSVEFRCSQWQTSATDMDADQCRVLLSWGGPALQIVGSFDAHRGMTTARLEYQDWGTPWTEYMGADEDALLWFAGLFCLGGY